MSFEKGNTVCKNDYRQDKVDSWCSGTGETQGIQDVHIAKEHDWEQVFPHPSGLKLLTGSL